MNSTAQDPELGRKIYSTNAPGVLLLYVQSPSGEYIAQGSGFLIEGSSIVTNAHVATAGRVSVELGPARVPTKVKQVDQLNDLAILSVEVEMTATPLRLASLPPSPGDIIFAIGNPEGLERSISQGVLSANREVGGRKLLQISTPISHGSSGGPVFNRDGEVVGVAVSMLAEGQNLNFAVPIDLVKALLRGAQANPSTVLSILQQITSLEAEQSETKYSDDPESAYQTKRAEIEVQLNKALDAAGKDPELLLKVTQAAQGLSVDIAAQGAQKVIDVRPSSEAYLLLVDALDSKYVFEQGASREGLMRRAESAARSAIKLARVPTLEMRVKLADVLKDEGQCSESESVLRPAVQATQADSTSDLYFQAIRSLAECAGTQNQLDEERLWFSELVKNDKATAFDWDLHGDRLSANKDFKGAGDAYSRAATALIVRDWCFAGTMYELSAEPDSALYAERQCIEKMQGKAGSEGLLAQSHASISNILSSRGVYTEALSHAKEATVLDPSYAFGFASEAEALFGLRRFNEAINASNEAIRLSDGKYSSYHFRLGSSYFETENWQLAEQSFERAAALDPKDDAAAYNVAVCYGRLGYYRDAARWYEEALRRNPNRNDRDDLRRQIEVLRR